MKFGIWLVAWVLVLSFGVSFAGKQPFPLKTAWKGGHETFLVWYAKKKKWDRELGLDVQLLHFESGRRIIDGVLAYDWDLAGCGVFPLFLSMLNQQVCVVGIANETTHTSTIFTRRAHPVLESRGLNPRFPQIYGSQETVMGRLIICPQGSSAQYMLVRWLAAIGLSERDVRIRYMDSEAGLRSFANGSGDIIAIGESSTGEAIRQGLQIVAKSADCGVRQSVLLVADRSFAREHPGEVGAFLKMYLRAVDAVRSMSLETFIATYSDFTTEWEGKKIRREDAIAVFANHTIFSLSEQLDLLDPKGGPHTLFARLAEMGAFVRQVRGPVQRVEVVLQPEFVENRFLRALEKKQRPR